MIIIHRLFRDTAHFCVCNRPVVFDLRNRHMRSLQLTCRVWYARWRAFVMYICIRGVQFCTAPQECWLTYQGASPRLPLLRRATQLCDRIEPVRVYRNGRVLVMLKSASAETPGEGTDH